MILQYKICWSFIYNSTHRCLELCSSHHVPQKRKDKKAFVCSWLTFLLLTKTDIMVQTQEILYRNWKQHVRPGRQEEPTTWRGKCIQQCWDVELWQIVCGAGQELCMQPGNTSKSAVEKRKEKGFMVKGPPGRVRVSLVCPWCGQAQYVKERTVHVHKHGKTSMWEERRGRLSSYRQPYDSVVP